MREPQKVPTVRTPRNPGEIQRFHGAVREYCAQEFEEGVSGSEITQRLWSKGGPFDIWVYVEREYLRFLGVSSRRLKIARQLSYVVGSLVGILAYVYLASPSVDYFRMGPTRAPHWITFVVGEIALMPVSAFLFERIVRTFWKVFGTRTARRKLHRSGP